MAIGWISAKTEFKQFVESNNLQRNVAYPGKKYGADKITYLENADIFVFPTFYHNEVFPLVLLEAMQFGLPVISTREGGIPDIVTENVTGYLIDRDDAEQLAEKVQYLLENTEERMRMGIAAKEKFDRSFCLDVFEKNMNGIFTALTEKTQLKWLYEE